MPDNVVFMDSYYYYDDYYMMDAEFGRRDVAYYPYHNGNGVERFAMAEDALVYYHVGEHQGTQWVYDEEAGRSLPTPQKKATDTLYIFDLSNIKDVDMLTLDIEAYSLQKLIAHKDELIVQHRMSGVDIWINNDYYYYSWYYKNYAMTIDLSDPNNAKKTGDYNVPGNVIGASDNVIFTLSDWYDNEHNVTLNTLTINNGSAKITSAVKVGTGQYSAEMYDNKVYLVKQPYYYYYYRGYDEVEQNTTLQVIDVSTPDEPVQELSVEMKGHISIEKIEAGHIVVYDSYQNALMIYSTDFDDELEFEAMILAQGGYDNLRVYENTIIVPQGYYPTIKAKL
jgi:hypothetical protein